MLGSPLTPLEEGVIARRIAQLWPGMIGDDAPADARLVDLVSTTLRLARDMRRPC